MKRQAGRPSKENLRPLDTNLIGTRSDEQLAKDSPDSARQIQRYIRLTELIPPVLDMVDSGKIAFRPAIELSYLSKEQQQSLYDTMECEDCTPSLAQAFKMKEFSRDGKLTAEVILSIMNNGTMFADLFKYESKDFYREHKIIRFDTLSGFGEYEIVAVFKTVAYSEQGFKYYHFTRAESAEDFDDYIAQCKALSLYDTGVTAEYGDRLITLSTCEYSRKNGRMVVVAKRIAAPSAEVGSDA